MAEIAKIPAVLVLADGTVFHGKSAGKIGTTTGEICFNTGMTGYQEIFTDPSYFGQIMVTTNVLNSLMRINSHEKQKTYHCTINENKTKNIICTRIPFGRNRAFSVKILIPPDGLDRFARREIIEVLMQVTKAFSVICYRSLKEPRSARSMAMSTRITFSLSARVHFML